MPTPDEVMAARIAYNRYMKSVPPADRYLLTEAAIRKALEAAEKVRAGWEGTEPVTTPTWR